MKEKLAIVASGGGMRAVYTAGLMLALAEVYKIKPDLLIGSSGSAGTMTYFTSGQYQSIRNIWLSRLSSRKFINPWRFWNIIDVDYLVDQVFFKDDPLDVQALHNSPIDLLIGATERKTGLIHYFSNRDRVNFNNVLKASKCWPIFSRRPAILVEGKEYFDSWISADVFSHIRMAISKGANKILAVRTEGREVNWLENIICKCWYVTRSREFKYGYALSEREINRFIIPKEVDVLIIRSLNIDKISSTEINPTILKNGLELGYAETIANTRIRNFLTR